jgi:hypothetical protein
MLKWTIKEGWKPKPFAIKAQEMYVEMNQKAFRFGANVLMKRFGHC